MPHAPDHDALPSSNKLNRPSLTIDWEVYAAMLEDSAMPFDQQKELIKTFGPSSLCSSIWDLICTPFSKSVENPIIR